MPAESFDPASEIAPAAEPESPDEGADLRSTSALLNDTPDVDLARYLEEQKRARQRMQLIGKFLIGFVPVVAILGYLRMAGYLHRPVPAAPISPAEKPGAYTLGGESPRPSPLPGMSPPPHVAKDPAVAKDLSDYVNNGLKNLNPYERQALTAFVSVTGANFTSQKETVRVLETRAMPAYAKFVAAAEALHPKTEPVRQVHQLFLLSGRVKMLAFQHMVDGKNDPTGAWQFGVKAEFDASSQLAQAFKVRISQLAQDQGVKLP